MKRPVLVRFRRIGYTLIEILVATTLSLLLMGAVVLMFARVTEGIADSRSMLEAADRLRLAEARLQMDLAGITATVNPPLKPENNEGYFEYIEGPAICNAFGTSGIAVNTDNNNQPDTTVGDFDDILMFTTRTTGKPFVGGVPPTIVVNGVPVNTNGTLQSDVAEVAWFVRGRTLHRRVLLVAPSVTLPAVATGYYDDYDISARWDSSITRLRANTLGDLTRREYRFAHPTALPFSGNAYWRWTASGSSLIFPTLPTLDECCSTDWSPEMPERATSIPNLPDFWTNVPNYRIMDYALATSATSSGVRVSDDVILTNVIGFDVRAWDPVQNNYVDLGTNSSAPLSGLNHPGQLPLQGSPTTARVYDTWSTTHYDPKWNNGIDDGGIDGVVDDDTEKLYPPPYPIPLRGIQVKIRVFEPDSRQVREVTVVQEFLPR